MIEDIDTTIIGAGPYGLSIAAHLRGAKIPFQMLGTPLESWRSFMPAGMILKSEAFASNLWDPAKRYTLKAYCQLHGQPFEAVGAPVPLDRFLNYADWFRVQTAASPLEMKVTSVRRARSGFQICLADGHEFKTSRIIAAAGHMAFRYIPPELRGVPEPFVMHSSRLGDLTRYTGKQIVIVGAGQSALETAALLHEAGAHVRLVTRRSHIEWNERSIRRPFTSRILRPDAGIASGWRSTAISELPRLFRICFPPAKRHRFVAGSYGPSGAWWLRGRLTDSIEMLFQRRIEAATSAAGRVRISLTSKDSASEVLVDHVVAATGYQVDLNRFDFLDPALLEEIAREAPGIPALTSSLETSVSGLFMVGLVSAPVFGPIMRFMYGAKHAAPIIAARLRSNRSRSRYRPVTRTGLAN